VTKDDVLQINCDLYRTPHICRVVINMNVVGWTDWKEVNAFKICFGK